MEVIAQRKISRITNGLCDGVYDNPFTFEGRIRNVHFFDSNKTFKDCRATCIYDNKICEIVTPDTIMTNTHHEHLTKIAKQWSIVPHLLMVEDGSIKNIIPYTTKNIASFDWTSASKTRNYILDDPLIDYLKHNNINPIVEIPQSVKRKRGYSETFDEQLMNNGNDFEISVTEYIKDNVGVDNFKKIGESYEALNYTKYIETLNAIKSNVPVIYQPILWNSSNKTFGCADLIIKSHTAKKLFPNYIDHYKNRNVYEVYDIKWSTVSLLSGTIYLNNDKKAKTYKAQLWIYTQALNKMTGDNISTAYILGKKNKRLRIEDDGSKSTETLPNTHNEIALIDFSKEKTNIKIFRQALKWLKDLKTNKELNHDPPNDPRLYPNMKNHNNEYHPIKKDLAIRNKEITLLYNVGPTHRKNAHSQGIYKLDDPNLTTEVLGLNPSLTTNLINNIIEVNSTDCTDLVLYNDLSNSGNWRNAKIRCYLDIEAISTTVYDLAHNKPNYIFMIGIGVVINDQWSFTEFTVNSLIDNEETRIIKEFDDFLDNLLKKHKRIKHIPVFHWANFERANLLPLLMINDKYQFHDMYKWVKDNGICVKGAYDFKLKNYAKAMYKNGLIDVEWPDGINDGINAMNTAYNYYTHDVGDVDVINDIKKYNEIDCKAMFAIHQYLKTID
jgi:hypothetical protein